MKKTAYKRPRFLFEKKNEAAVKFGETLRTLFKKTGASYGTVANDAGIHLDTLKGIIYGLQPCDPDKTEAIAKTLRLSPEHTYLLHTLAARAFGYKI
jgi:predicted transcriptional regulator